MSRLIQIAQNFFPIKKKNLQLIRVLSCIKPIKKSFIKFLPICVFTCTSVMERLRVSSDQTSVWAGNWPEPNWAQNGGGVWENHYNTISYCWRAYKHTQQLDFVTWSMIPRQIKRDTRTMWRDRILLHVSIVHGRNVSVTEVTLRQGQLVFYFLLFPVNVTLSPSFSLQG